jgi:hypothetical protein
MRWGDEQFVKVFIRDTPDFMALGWEARALFWELLRKSDRAGIFELGKSGDRGVAAVTGIPFEVVERALRILVDDGCIEHRGACLVVRNKVDAQKSQQSDKARQQKAREVARDDARSKGAKPSRNVTPTQVPVTFCDKKSISVTQTSDPVTPRSDQIRREELEEISVCPETAEPSAVPPEPALLTYPCDGKPGFWALTQSQVSEWSTLYPSLDVLGESRKALAWVQAAPARRKTAGGMARFLVGWLGRSQNSAPARASPRQGGSGLPENWREHKAPWEETRNGNG